MLQHVTTDKASKIKHQVKHHLRELASVRGIVEQYQVSELQNAYQQEAAESELEYMNNAANPDEWLTQEEKNAAYIEVTSFSNEAFEEK